MADPVLINAWKKRKVMAGVVHAVLARGRFCKGAFLWMVNINLLRGAYRWVYYLALVA